MATKKSIIFASVFLFAFLFSIVGVMGALVNPANSATLTGSSVLNATNSSLPDMVNCTFYAKSSLTANSSWTSLGTFTNASANPLNINGTFASTILEDANNYIFNATCTNSTNAQTSSVSSASVIIQNTVPDAPSLTTHSNHQVITTKGTVTFSASLNDAETTSCTYTIARGGASAGSDYFAGAGSYSAGTCSFTKAFSGSQDNGAWYVTMTASDETDTTSSGATIVDVGIAPNSGGLPSETTDTVNPEPTGGNTAVWIIVGILCLIILMGVIVYLMSS